MITLTRDDKDRARFADARPEEYLSVNFPVSRTKIVPIHTPEEQARNTMIIEIDDSLRLVFRDGQYDGWYNALSGIDDQPQPNRTDPYEQMARLQLE